MQRRDQQRRVQGGGGGGSSSFTGGSSNIGSYSPVPRYEAPAPAPRNASPAAPTLKPPAFKSSGMKLGAKKASNSQLLEELGADATPQSAKSEPQRSVGPTVALGRGNIPTIEQKRYVL
jgi:hypothetical protein